MKLSLIDLSPIPYGGSRAEAYQNTIETAQHIEQLGYHRIWLAEHHNSPQLGGRAPEVLIPTIASKTSKIRVGSGSVLLNHYSPFKVAEILDRKSTRLNSSHVSISYAVFCLKKKNNKML